MAKKEKRQADSAGKSDKLGESISAYTDPELYQISKAGFTRDLQEGNYKILDLCSGKGLATYPFCENNEIYYLDLSTKMIEVGKEEGYIAVQDDNVIIDEAENLLNNKKLEPNIGDFDVILNRFSFHDFTNATFAEFKNDKRSFYKKGRRYQKCIISKLKKTLKPSGELQIIDIAVPPDKSDAVKNFYNHYHAIKTLCEPMGVHIPTTEELREMVEENGFSISNVDWYRSEVSPTDWYKENQINKERLSQLRKLFAEGYTTEQIRETFKITRKGEDKFCISFPVVVLTAQA